MTAQGIICQDALDQVHHPVEALRRSDAYRAESSLLSSDSWASSQPLGGQEALTTHQGVSYPDNQSVGFSPLPPTDAMVSLPR